MKRVILITFAVLLTFSCKNVIADDTVTKVQTGIGILGGILNKTSKSQENKQQITQNNEEQAQATNDQNNSTNAQSQAPIISKEDISMLMKKIRTNLTEEQLVRTSTSMIYTGSYPYEEFGYFLFLVGEGQFSKQDKERILKKQIVDPGTNWKSKIRSIAVNGSTMMIETDMMTYSGNSMKSDKVDYIFNKAGEGVISFDSIQMVSKDTRVGGDAGYMTFTTFMGAIQKFIDKGSNEQVW